LNHKIWYYSDPLLIEVFFVFFIILTTHFFWTSHINAEIWDGRSPGIMTSKHAIKSTVNAAQFWRDGFTVASHLISPALAERVRNRFEPLFAGSFDTGLFPDEWHWREGLSLPNKPREIVNAWKCDLTIRQVALSRDIGQFVSKLMRWDQVGVRLAQDSVIWKPPQTDGIAFHQDSAYISKQFIPYANNSLTVWIALDDANPVTGVVQYAVGSHVWQQGTEKTAVTSSFHGEVGAINVYCSNTKSH
jgi:phytanoyl-CoA hydroxylase